MKYPVLIRPEAESDLEEAFSWYENKRRGLGYDFLLQVEAGLRFIGIIRKRIKRSLNAAF